MSEDRERSKISLRSGKRKGRPQISAPRQISEPILQDGSGPVRPPDSRPTADAGPPPVQPRLRPPPQAGGGKVSNTPRMERWRAALRLRELTVQHTDLGLGEATILDAV
ncbi:exocyst complex component exo84 [Colletotrichum tofieldiae]|nr:exocyst complex component exo84 [Colletotrichum tofieldiae]